MTNFTASRNLHPEYKAGVMIWKVVPPVLIGFGTFGNVLSIVVLTRKALRSSTTSLFLTVLAVADLITLYTGLLRLWIKYMFDVSIRDTSTVWCKVTLWEIYTALHFSAWILVGITLERTIIVWFPHRAKSTCTKKAAVAYMITTLVVTMLLNSHLLYGAELHQHTHPQNGTVHEHMVCFVKAGDYTKFYRNVWVYLDLCAFSAVPSLVISVGNFLILVKLYKKRRFFRPNATCPTAYTLQRQSTSISQNSTMTAMLVTLNFAFLLSTLPIMVYIVGQKKWLDEATETNDSHALAQMELCWAIANMFMYSSTATNFFLYCLSGSRFRQEVKTMFMAQFHGLWTECLNPLRCLRATSTRTVEPSHHDEECVEGITYLPSRSDQNSDCENPTHSRAEYTHRSISTIRWNHIL